MTEEMSNKNGMEFKPKMLSFHNWRWSWWWWWWGCRMRRGKMLMLMAMILVQWCVFKVFWLILKMMLLTDILQWRTEALYLGRSWSRVLWWRWSGWWPPSAWWRSSAAGRGWCVTWGRRGSPTPQSHSGWPRCTWWWSEPVAKQTQKHSFTPSNSTVNGHAVAISAIRLGEFEMIQDETPNT